MNCQTRVIVLISFFIPIVKFEGNRFNALLSHIFLFKMFVPSFEASFGIHFWFVSTIIQFYLLAIPIFKIKEKMKNKEFLFLGVGISMLWWIICLIMNLKDRIWTSFFLQYFWEFCLGIILADIFYRKKKIEIKYVYLLFCIVFGLSLQFGMTMINDVLKLFNDIPGMVGYISIALLLLQIPFIKKILEIFCKHSYELYLIHILVFTIIYLEFDSKNT